jgi:hypothetical protein
MIDHVGCFTIGDKTSFARANEETQNFPRARAVDRTKAFKVSPEHVPGKTETDTGSEYGRVSAGRMK